VSFIFDIFISAFSSVFFISDTSIICFFIYAFYIFYIFYIFLYFFLSCIYCIFYLYFFFALFSVSTCCTNLRVRVPDTPFICEHNYTYATIEKIQTSNEDVGSRKRSVFAFPMNLRSRHSPSCSSFLSEDAHAEFANLHLTSTSLRDAQNSPSLFLFLEAEFRNCVCVASPSKFHNGDSRGSKAA